MPRSSQPGEPRRARKLIGRTWNDQARRERGLSYILAGLTTFTVVSVAADAYNFVRENEPIIDDRVQRLELLIEFLLALGLLAGMLVFLFLRQPRPR